MKQFTYTITDPVGIHARPAGLLAKAGRQGPGQYRHRHQGGRQQVRCRHQAHGYDGYGHQAGRDRYRHH